MPLIALTAVVAIAAGLLGLALGIAAALIATPVLLLRQLRRQAKARIVATCARCAR